MRHALCDFRLTEVPNAKAIDQEYWDDGFRRHL